MIQIRMIIDRLTRRIWFRAGLISLFSVFIALAANWLAPVIPYDFSMDIGAKAVDQVLGILATSMLAVTTFSLASMVTAFGSAAQNITPRATQLLIEDHTAQNALSTFLGGFLFGVVGIVALSTDFYGAEGRAVLFIGTIIMISWIVLTLLRWIATLTEFGRMGDAVRRVEEAACAAITRHDGPVAIGGDGQPPIPVGATAVTGSTTGYVTHVDLDRIAACIRTMDAQILIVGTPGAMVDRATPLAWIDRKISEEESSRIATAFSVERERRFADDPRFGMVVLSEIASRALSPAVNDPGTAVSVIAAAQRVAEAVLDKHSDKSGGASAGGYALSLEAMLEELTLSIGRDGAAIREVQGRLQSMLGSLARQSPAARPMVKRLADEAMQRARSSDISEADIARIERAHSEAFRTSPGASAV
ncbi:DUF2254 domain-containing protein [Sphingomonas xanthus]|uniref:DUF2254 domain-containing protein n=1 Tax=Sphingomonas xanthus TaxID=2594473 RepID=A0A516IRW1_9SPHN|nr:DUF2254 domain-containing protein [Sphingomonas xanthus]QDP19610.1 DUF2254 domain-containing protein [Sphingomonas xanthus]